MAKTRGDSGITVPRSRFSIPTAGPKTATKKKTTATTKKPSATPKANTSKPRAKKAAATKNKTATGRVSKAAAAPNAKKTTAPATKKAPKTTNHREPSLLDKVQGVAEQIAGVVQGKPGKKVRLSLTYPTCLFVRSMLCEVITTTTTDRLSADARVFSSLQAAGTKKIKGTDGKGATRAKKE
ncbi:MAG: hypothetical protein LQ343_003742 [Gyalolechia ehrenbergii]|nr:MAG: hypothetical protein LQ343_003742 [Gyalolechia ehrenbergii]